ncbi:hypothetical protein FKM82_016873 [Ascaphus truei]
MTILILLPFLLQATSGYLVGPREVTGALGGSVMVTCHYRTISVNIHSRKFWCKMSRGACDTVVSTSGYTASGHVNRTHLADFQTDGNFMVQMTQLGHKDAGLYRCGIGSNNNGFYFPVMLAVSAGPKVPSASELVFGTLRGSLTIRCPMQPESSNHSKYWCKMERADCTPIVHSDGYVHKDLWGRVLIKEEETPTGFVVLLNDLKKTDSGYYRCGTGLFEEGMDWKDVHVYISSDKVSPRIPKLLSGFPGGSVTAVCPFTPAAGPTSVFYWCKWSESGCMRLIDSTGLVQDAFKERLVLEKDNVSNVKYTVWMTQLRLGDTGWYWCGITDGQEEQTSSMEIHILDTTTKLYPGTATRGGQSSNSSHRNTTALPSATATAQDTTIKLYPGTASRGGHSSTSSHRYTSFLPPASATAQETVTSPYPGTASMGGHSTASSHKYTSALPPTDTSAQDTTTKLHPGTASREGHSSASSQGLTTTLPPAAATAQGRHLSVKPTKTAPFTNSKSRMAHSSMTTSGYHNSEMSGSLGSAAAQDLNATLTGDNAKSKITNTMDMLPFLISVLLITCLLGLAALVLITIKCHRKRGRSRVAYEGNVAMVETNLLEKEPPLEESRKLRLTQDTEISGETEL